MSDPTALDPSIAEVFTRHLAYQRETTLSYLMSKIAFAMADFTDLGVKKFANHAKRLKRGGADIPPDLLKDDHASDLVKYAEEESKKGYPMLTAQVAVALWGGLEALVEDVLVALISSHPEVYSSDLLQGVRVRLSMFELMDKEDRARYLLRELDTKGPRSGVNAFEPLLSHFGLAGSVKKETEVALFELSNVRNVIVHRLHLVDSRFVEAVPKLGYRKGDRLVVRQDQVDRYVIAISDYSVALSYRMGAKWPRQKIEPKTNSDNKPEKEERKA